MQETLDNCRKCSMCHWNIRRGRKKWISSFFKLRNIWSHNDWEFLQSRCCQSLSHVWLHVNPQTAACQVPLFFTISRGLLKFMSLELVMPANHLILCFPLLLLPLIFISIRVFLNELAICNRWPNYRSFSFSISYFFQSSILYLTTDPESSNSAHKINAKTNNSE